MFEEDPFLASIKEHPEGDGPRLVYADWLEERGDPRAEFIRIQCELAKYSPQQLIRHDFVERELELIKRHGQAWRKKDLGSADRFLHSVSPYFRRGFIAGVELDADVGGFFMEVGLDWLEEMLTRITNPEVTLRNLERVRGLTRLLNRRWVPRVHTLILDANPIGLRGIRVLATSTSLSGLQNLHLNHTGITDAALWELRQSAIFSQLCHLELVGNKLSEAFRRRLLRSPRFRRLTILGLKVQETPREDLNPKSAPTLMYRLHDQGRRGRAGRSSRIRR